MSPPFCWTQPDKDVKKATPYVAVVEAGETIVAPKAGHLELWKVEAIQLHHISTVSTSMFFIFFCSSTLEFRRAEGWWHYAVSLDSSAAHPGWAVWHFCMLHEFAWPRNSDLANANCSCMHGHVSRAMCHVLSRNMLSKVTIMRNFYSTSNQWDMMLVCTSLHHDLQHKLSKLCGSSAVFTEDSSQR